MPESLADALLRRIRDVVAIVNNEGVLAYVSDGCESLLGTKCDRLTGTSAFDLVHPDDQIDAFEGFVSTSSFADSRPTPLLLRLRHADGRWIDTEVIATNHLGDSAVDGLLLTIRDVSESMRTEEALRRSEGRYRLIVELAHEGIFMVDRVGMITYANRALATMLHTTVNELLGQPIFAFMTDEDRGRAQSYARRGKATTEAHEFRMKAADDAIVWVRISANPLLLHDGTQNGIVAVVTDVTERRALEQRLAHDARHDALTGLANRHTLFDALTRALNEGQQCAVLFADLDHFKDINDTYGHLVGDEVLRIAARRITAAVRDSDLVSRVGGDEFVVVCSPIRTKREVAEIAARIVGAFDTTIRTDHDISTSISVGVAPALPTDTADTLLARADHALYAAKRAGRNNLHFALST